ncbi:MAG: hflK 1, partial [Acidobacteria bacterium]|nr:hflK 1 [Acidobacteriota bacterium]
MALITSRRSTQYNADPPRANIVAILILLGALAVGGLLTLATGSAIPIVVLGAIGAILMQAPRVAQQWERAVVLRLGR